MLSNIRLIINSLRIIIPVIVLFGSAPTFFILWFLLRLITLICFLPHRVYRRYDDYLYSLYQQSVLFFFENWVRTKIYFHGDYDELIKRKENVFYISNHQSEVDWIVANMLAVRQGSLGHLRYVLKNDLKWIPLYGFYFEQHGCIYVRRNDKGDLERVQKGIGQIKTRGLPVWLVIFPEGTRYSHEKNPGAIERARAFAEKKGVPPFDNVLYPKTGAAIAAINALKDKLDAVYDVTVVYSKTDRPDQSASPSMGEYLQGEIQDIHIHIKRIPIDLIPKETNEEITNWIYERFVIKDKLLTNFYDVNRNKRNIFDFNSNQEGVLAPLNLSVLLLPCIFFLLITILLFLTPQGRLIYWNICLFGTPISLVWMHLFPSNKFN